MAASEPFDTVKALLGQYLPDDVMPSDDEITTWCASIETGNPYRVIYNVVVAASLKTTLQADQFSDDGVSYKQGIALSALKDLLPMFKTEMQRWDSANGESWIGFAYPQDALDTRFEAYGI
jgi:hypothetical protein